MSSQIYVAIDDATPKFLSIGGGTWTVAGDDAVQNHWFGGTTLFPGFSGNNASAPGSMAFSFQGTAVALFGNTAGNNDDGNQNFKVSIDGSAPYSTSTGDKNPQTYMQWYQSPTLDDGNHKIEITGMRGQAIDLVLVTPGPNTDLAGKTLMVDDTYSGFKYNGNGWKTVSDAVLQETTTIHAKAFQNSTHQSSSVGDSFTFSYTGTNATVYGIQPQTGGSNTISFTYAIDKGSPLTVTLVPTKTDGTDLLNLPLFSTGSIPAGDHTITVKLTAAQGQPLIIDYALFTPSFSSLSAIPDGSTASLSPLTSGSTPNGGNTTNSLPGVTPISGTYPGTSSQTPGAFNGKESRSSSAGAIAGGVVGGLAVLALLILGLYIIHRRRGSRKAPVDDDSESSGAAFRATAPMSEQDPRPFLLQTPSASSSKFNEIMRIPSTPQNNGIGTPRLASPAPLSSDYRSTMTDCTGQLARDQALADIQLRLAALQQAVANADGASSSGSSHSQDVNELRYQIDILTRENERLATIAQPPAYGTSLSH